MERIINSLIDTDLYKLTMGQAVFHNYPHIGAGYEFINRGKTEFPDQFDKKLQDQVEQMAGVELQSQEKRFLNDKCNGIFTPDYLDWFENYHLNPGEVKIKREKGSLSIDIEGPWQRTIYWEVPLMAAISELYFQQTGQGPVLGWEEKALQKALIFKEAKALFAEFGTRRRYSKAVHQRVLEILQGSAGKSLIGTSNVEMALKFGLTPVGTFAHELVMAMAGIYGVELANIMTLKLWNKEYQGKLATALTDTYTTGTFLKDFSREFTEVFKTLRQDSGNPNEWTDNVVRHLFQLGINPLTRTALYSDALDIYGVLDILKYNCNKINSIFGIGTNLTNDVGVAPLNMVIKLHHVNIGGKLIGVCKLSDNPGKVSGNPEVVSRTVESLALAA